MCEDVYKISTAPDTEWVTTNYGSLFDGATRTVFVNGNIDPWHSLSVIDNSTLGAFPDSLAVFINGTAHCGDMYLRRSSDLDSLVDAHGVIGDHVAAWLK